MDLTLSDLERAINYWRAKKPSTGEERRLSVEVNSLAHVYALMIFHGQSVLPSAQVDGDVSTLVTQWRSHQDLLGKGQSGVTA
jgi:hypothetical protein